MGPEPSFTIRVESRNQVTMVTLGGELDVASAPTLTRHLKLAEQSDVCSIALDLRDLTFIDSSGLRVLLQANSRAKTNGHRLLILGVGPTPRRMLDATGTASLLDTTDAVGVLDRFTRGARRPTDDGAASADGDGRA